jgi:hypothetical protein
MIKEMKKVNLFSGIMVICSLMILLSACSQAAPVQIPTPTGYSTQTLLAKIIKPTSTDVAPLIPGPTSTPRFKPVCANPPPVDHYAHSDAFGDGYVARLSVRDAANLDHKELLRALVKQWLEHYKTHNKPVSAALKAYSINEINLGDPYCDPYFIILGGVKFSITPVQIPNEYASFPADNTDPTDATWFLSAPFAVFKDGDDYRLRLVFGWGT